MRAIRSKDTRMEVVFRKALWSKGFRYRKNVSNIFGKPDLVLRKYKIAIFIDSEYFHGKEWQINKKRIKTNREFWWKKIESNIKRDVLVNEKLKEDGWEVLRFWCKDVEKNLDSCILQIEKRINKVTK